MKPVVDIKSDLGFGFWMRVVHIGDTDHFECILVECRISDGAFEAETADIAVGMEIEGDDIGSLLSGAHGDIGITVTGEDVLGDAVYLAEMIADKFFLHRGKAVKLPAVEFADDPFIVTGSMLSGVDGSTGTEEGICQSASMRSFFWVSLWFLLNDPLFHRFGGIVFRFCMV